MTLTKQYFQGLNGVVLVYNVYRWETFERIKFWIKTIKENIDLSSVKIILLGHQMEDEDKKERVSTKEGEELAKTIGCKYYDVYVCVCVCVYIYICTCM